MPTVALADEFLDAFARIPRAQQKKVREFTAKFRADPRSSAINYTIVVPLFPPVRISCSVRLTGGFDPNFIARFPGLGTHSP
jgi:hypothetical protein